MLGAARRLASQSFEIPAEGLHPQDERIGRLPRLGPLPLQRKLPTVRKKLRSDQQQSVRTQVELSHEAYRYPRAEEESQQILQYAPSPVVKLVPVLAQKMLVARM